MVRTSVQLGDKVELTVKSREAEEESDVYYSMVYTLPEDNYIQVQAPIENNHIIPLHENKEYYMTIYTERGLFRTSVRLSERLKEDKLHILKLEYMTPLKKFQRRQYYRLDYVMTFTYKIHNSEDQEMEMVESTQLFKGQILDVSAGGIRFHASEAYERGTFLDCFMTLMKNGEQLELALKAKVLQSIENEEADGYQIRIRFVDVPAMMQEDIIKFIFEEERRRRKKEKGM